MKLASLPEVLTAVKSATLVALLRKKVTAELVVCQHYKRKLENIADLVGYEQEIHRTPE